MYSFKSPFHLNRLVILSVGSKDQIPIKLWRDIGLYLRSNIHRSLLRELFFNFSLRLELSSLGLRNVGINFNKTDSFVLVSTKLKPSSFRGEASGTSVVSEVTYLGVDLDSNLIQKRNTSVGIHRYCLDSFAGYILDWTGVIKIRPHAALGTLLCLTPLDWYVKYYAAQIGYSRGRKVYPSLQMCRTNATNCSRKL